mgnify:CR=1 FL=1
MMARDCMGMLSQKLFESILSWLQPWEARILNLYIPRFHIRVYRWSDPLLVIQYFFFANIGPW